MHLRGKVGTRRNVVSLRRMNSEDPAVSLTKLSINQFATLVRADRATVQRRADQLGLQATPGPKHAKLYNSYDLLQLVPIPTRAGAASEGAVSLEEARIRQTNADAEVKELTAKKLRGELADVSEVMAAQNDLFDQIGAIIKKSALPDADKEDILAAISEVPRKVWGDL